jgi:hypothetical protein
MKKKQTVIANISETCRGTVRMVPETSTVNNEKSYLLADSHSILNRCWHNFSQLLNVRGVHNVRQLEIHTAGPLVSEPSTFEVEMAIEKLKRYRLAGTDQIPAEMIQSECRTIHSEIHNLINSVWNKEELPYQ